METGSGAFRNGNSICLTLLCGTLVSTATWGWVDGGLGPRLNPWNLKKGEGETLQAYRPEPRIPGREQDPGRWGSAPPALIPYSFVEVSPAGPGPLQAAPGPLPPDPGKLYVGAVGASSGISLAWVLGSPPPPPGTWSGASSETWLWTSPCLNLHLWLGTEWEAFPRDTEGFSVSPAPCHLPSSSSVLTASASVGPPICPLRGRPHPPPPTSPVPPESSARISGCGGQKNGGM